MDWIECKKEKFVKDDVFVDKLLIKVLKEKADEKFKFIDSLEINNLSAETIVCDFYDILRMFLEALAMRNGFKIKNHECYCSFISEFLNLNELSIKFNYLRKIRNGINYYKKRVNAIEAKDLITDLKDAIYQVKKNLEEKHD